jgi:LPS O-antigen subunit length determinant protein (WzzB/FepE family)
MESVEVPLMKSRPRRTLIVSGVTLGAFFFSIFMALLLEKYRDINWKELLHDA